MAEAKKVTTAKASANSTDTKTAEKAPVKKVTEKAPAKAVEKAPAAATAAKKAPVKKTAAKKTAVKKTEIKEVYNIQFDGKSYTTEDLMKIAKDVWKYDLKMKASDFKTVEFYIKPEESLTYYVINGDVTGSFLI